MDFHTDDTAVVIVDPLNDVLSESGISWDLVGQSFRENNTIENLGRLIGAAKQRGLAVFVSPHYLYPGDQLWRFGGIAEKGMLTNK